MSKATVLQRVIDDIAHKDLGKARDRLHTLVQQYPYDLELRHILGRIYLGLCYPREAGRHLYLVDDKSEAVLEAKRQFAKSCSNNPCNILSALKMRRKIDPIQEGYGKDTLRALRVECDEFLKEIRERVKSHGRLGYKTLVLETFGIGCLLFLAVALIMGIIVIGKWVYKLAAGLF